MRARFGTGVSGLPSLADAATDPLPSPCIHVFTTTYSPVCVCRNFTDALEDTLPTFRRMEMFCSIHAATASLNKSSNRPTRLRTVDCFKHSIPASCLVLISRPISLTFHSCTQSDTSRAINTSLHVDSSRTCEVLVKNVNIPWIDARYDFLHVIELVFKACITIRTRQTFS